MLLKYVRWGSVFFMSFVFGIQATAAPVTVYGPQKFNSALIAAKEYSINFKGPAGTTATQKLDAVLSIQNGDGQDIVMEKCTGTAVLKLLCLARNLLREAKILIDRPLESEIILNGTTVLARGALPRATGKVQKAIKIQANNVLKIRLRGLPTSSLTIDVKSNSQSVNLPPIANFTFNPTSGTAPQIITFSALASSDPDGTIASYAWNFGDGTFGTGALINHLYAQAGTYNASLTVTDNQGATNVKTASVVITANQLPVASFLANSATGLGELKLLLNASASSDPDGTITDYTWNFGDGVILSTGLVNTTEHIYASPGVYQVTLKVTDNKSGTNSVSQNLQVIDNVAPIIAITSPTANAVFTSAGVSVTGTSNEKLASANAQVNGGVITSLTVSADGLSFSGGLTLSGSGAKVLIISAADIAGNIGTATVNFTMNMNLPPLAVIKTPIPQAGIFPLMVYLDANGSSDPNGDALSYIWDFGDGKTETTQRPTVTHEFGSLGSFTVKVTVKDPDGLTDSKSTTVQTFNVALPANPSDVAPPLASSAGTPFENSINFLFSGLNPIQTDVAANALENRRLGLVRGRVLDESGSPLGGVQISIFDQPSWGKTLTRADGNFDLAVNAGGMLTVEYKRNGYLPSQRQAFLNYNEFEFMPDVVLVRPDDKVSRVLLNQSSTIAISGKLITDGDGSRTGVLVIPSSTNAELVFADNSRKSLPELSIRITEYTVGDRGPQQMPATLPATSAYTYAFEVNADEAIAMGASHIEFSKPVAYYVNNFIGFEAGTPVPVGTYDFQKAQWIPQMDGLVIKVMSIANGKAVLDILGENAPAKIEELAILRIDDGELAKIAELYAPGQSFWRAQTTRFSPVDYNFLAAQVRDFNLRTADLGAPNSLSNNTPPDGGTCQNGSIIRIENQSLGEQIPLVGSELTLNYSSDRAFGASGGNQIFIPILPVTYAGDIPDIILEVQVAGKLDTIRLGITTSIKNYLYSWDGKDSFGRTVYGDAVVKIKIRYGFITPYIRMAVTKSSNGSYALPTQPAFGRTDSDLVTIFPGRERFYLEKNHLVPVASITPTKLQGVGGWTLSEHHFYEPKTQTLLLGNGTKQKAGKMGNKVVTIAGSGESIYSGDGGLAIDAKVRRPRSILAMKDGSVVFVDNPNDNNMVLRKITPAGSISVIAGCITCSNAIIEGADVFNTRFQGNIFTYLAEDLDSSIIVATEGQIFRIKNNKINFILIGRELPPIGNGDGGPAINAIIGASGNYGTIGGLAVGSDGSIYVGDYNGFRVRKISTDGIINSIAGNGSPIQKFTEGQLATKVGIGFVTGVAVDRKGVVYFSSNNDQVKAVDTDGIIQTVAGGDNIIGTPVSDNVLATTTTIREPKGLNVDQYGNLYILEAQGLNIRKVDNQGIISTIAGVHNILTGANLGLTSENALASQTQLSASSLSGSSIQPISFGVLPNGDIVYAQELSNSIELTSKIRKITSIFPKAGSTDYIVSSNDGSEVYRFDVSGKHLETRHAQTGALKYSFAYSANNRLISVTDGDGLITQIDRATDGTPLQIISSFGQSTQLQVNAEGLLSQVTNAQSESYVLGYNDRGFLASYQRPKGNASQFTYDAQGFLKRDTNAVGGFTDLVRTVSNAGYHVTMSTAENRTSHTEVMAISGNKFSSTKLDPANLMSSKLFEPNGLWTTAHSNGVLVQERQQADPRLGPASMFVNFTRVTLPSSLKNETSVSRSYLRQNSADLFDYAERNTITQNGKVSTMDYDSLTRIEKITTSEGRVIQKAKDPQSRMIASQVGSLNQTNFIYNSQGQLVQSTQGARNTALAYDSQGLLASVTNPLLQKTEFIYDGAGRVSAQKFPDGRIIGFNYDANGNRISLTPPGRPVHQFTFDLVDMLNNYQAPDIGIPRTTTYAYNLDKQLTLITRPDSKTAVMNYDAINGRLMSIVTATGNYNYSYAPITGVLASLSSPDGVVSSMSYDGSLVKSVAMSGTASGSVQYTYNNDFLITKTQVNSANDIGFTYTNDNLLKTAGALTLNYDPVNPLIVGSSLGVATDSLGYSSFGELTSYAAKISGSDIYSINLVRDDLGRIITRTENIQGVASNSSYGYDSSGRLTNVNKDGELSSYSFDSNSNRIGNSVRGVAISSTYDNQDRLLTYGTKSFVYNANGDLVSFSDAATGRTSTFNYDVMGNLKSYSRVGRNIEYIIDGLDRRVGKKINGVVRQRFVYQNKLQVIAELDGAGNLVSRFVYASKSNVPDFMIKGATTYRIFSDNLGSPRLVVDISSGEVVQRIDYDEFGLILNDTNSGFIPFGFAGGLSDMDTGLVRFGARDYHPEIGRWVTKDPIGFSGGDTNLFGYVMGDPVNLIDPSGRFGIAGATVGFISGAIGGYVTGGAWGGVVGSVIGAGVGAVNPWGASAAGSFVGGVVSSLAGQVVGNAVAQQPLLSIDPALAVASGFGGSTAVLGTRAAAAAGISNVAVESGVATIADLLFNIPANTLTPGPYDFGKMCK
ncbi:MAG: PKD domain-containing protein [Bdellovibrionota bacterium]